MSEIQTMLRAEDVMKSLRVAKPTAYQVIKKLNTELEAKGVRTIPGRVSKSYFESVYFGTREEG